MTPLSLQDCPGTTLVSDLADLLRSHGYILGNNVTVECREPVSVHSWLGDQIIRSEHPTYRMSVTASALDCNYQDGLNFFGGALGGGFVPFALGQHEARVTAVESSTSQNGIVRLELEMELRPRIEFQTSPYRVEGVGNRSTASTTSNLTMKNYDDNAAIAACVKEVLRPPTPEERREIERQMEEDA
jgi:hypothetical protein